MESYVSCYDCRYFSPGEFGCASWEHDQEIGEYEETKEGICRRHTPRHGKAVTEKNGDKVVSYGEWPKVVACEWCGEFEARVKAKTAIMADS